VSTVTVKAKLKSDLRDKLKAVSQSLSVAIQSKDLTGTGKTYEAWVLLELALRLSKKAGIMVQATGHDGKTVTAFKLRGGPGHIPPAHASGNQPSHFTVWRKDKVPIELHLSLEHEGASTALHELDISAVATVHAHQIRFNGGGPFKGHRYLGVELKAYDAGTVLPKAVARALLGAAVDLDLGTVLQGAGVLPKAHSPLWWPQWAPKHWLLTTAHLSPQSQTYLAKYGMGYAGKINPQHDLILNDIAGEIAKFV